MREEQRAEWLAERRHGIGGSEAAPVLGLSPWKTPYEVWEDKCELVPLDDEDTEAKAYGRMMEPVLRQCYADRTGRSVIVPKTILVHPKHKFMLANLDGLTDDRVLEIKTSQSREGWGEPGSDEIPLIYMLQVQHYMCVTALPVADVFVSIAGNPPRLYEVPADLELQEMIIDAEAAFWDLVVNRIPPEPVNTADAIARYGRRSEAGKVNATEEVFQAWVRLKNIEGAMSELDQEADKVKTIILSHMGELDTLVAPDGKVLATWKKSKDGTKFDVKAFEAKYPKLFKRFLIEKPGSRRFLAK